MFRNWMDTTFESLKDPHYRILWLGTSLAFLAFSMSWIVQGVVAFEITGKNGQVGVVALGMGVSTIVTAPFGGVIADRVSKRKLLLIGQGLTAVNFTGVGVLIVLDMITIPLLVFSTFVMGLVFSFIAPARQAWIGVLLKGPRLGNGIALQQVAMTATRILGPGMAAALIAVSVIGSGGAYLFMGLLLAIVVATLAKMPPSPAPPRDPKSTALSGLSDGARHVKSRPRLALLTMSFIATVVFGFSYQVILPGYLHNVHGRETSDMGLLLVVSGVAGLVATMAVANRAGSAAAWPLLLIGAAVLGLGLIGLGMAPTFGLSLALMLVIGAGASVFQLLNSALVMQESDPAYYGRVMSLTMMAWGFNSLAGLPFGLLADGIGEQGTLAAMGAGVLVITALTAVLRGFARRSEPEPIAIANPASDRFAT
ncbi:MAG: MFS transporter [Dehalococcoidia bacterium]|nr:MFS transporter [Dehalococcoidia bacterium]